MCGGHARRRAHDPRHCRLQTAQTRRPRAPGATRALARALCVALGAASVREIAALNIYQATALAMRRALSRLSVVPDTVLVDGKPIKTLGFAHRGVIGGDAQCHSIACASIVAKVTRDRLMRALAARYPTYRWEKNSGYGTPEHISALREMGLSVHHRVAFCRTALS